MAKGGSDMRQIIGAVIGILLFSATAYAHSPQDIAIKFDPKTKILSAVITHVVGDPATHYIKKADLSINGTEIIQQKISRQDNKANQTVMWSVPDAKAGDVLAVEAYCSISGKLSKKITVQ